MARHNRDGHGTDQDGNEYEISYQPDWLRWVKVTRTLPNGRRSTKTLFRNPAWHREQEPGQKVRTRIVCGAEDIDFGIEVDDPDGVVRRIVVETSASGRKRGDTIGFTVENNLAPPSS